MENSGKMAQHQNAQISKDGAIKVAVQLIKSHSVDCHMIADQLNELSCLDGALLARVVFVLMFEVFGAGCSHVFGL